MMNDSSNPNHIGDDSAQQKSQRTSLGRRFQHALAGGPNRRFPGLHPSPGGAASIPPYLNRRLALPILAILALLAASLLFLLPGGPLLAQDSSIVYKEDRTDRVAIYSATDPEGRPVYWSLLPSDGTATDTTISASTDSADAAEFSISANGVLSFNFAPDYENPRGQPLAADSNENTYRVVVVAADEPQGAAGRVLGYEEVTVNVTDADEPGVIGLSAQQAQEGGTLTATLSDDDASGAQVTAATWKWEHSDSKNGPWTAILTATTGPYPVLGVADKYLRATATYTDGHGSDKTVEVVTTHKVRAVPAANNASPVFPDEDAVALDIQVGRKVDENSLPGTRVGDPVMANDAPGDVLTYTFSGSGANDSSYRIDPATGQITVGPRTSLATGTHTVEVTATDPAGGSTTQSVTITINDVNAVPVITAGDTKASVEENTAIATQVGAAAYAAYPEVITDACEAGTCTWSLEGTDAGDFEISNAAGTLGQLTFKESPNYEMPADANGDNVYMVTVVVTDAGIDGKGKLSAERDMVVTVTNVNEPVSGDTTPVVTLSSLAPKVGVALTATLDDPDGGEKDIEWQWSITGADTASVPGTPTATSPGDISGATSDTYTPKINDVEGTLTATVMYADAVGSSRTGTAAAVNGVVQDLSAQAPVFKPKPASRSVPENYATDDQYGGTGGTDYTYPNVGAMVTATDPNGDTLTYSLGGTDAGSFTIHQGTGQISVKTATKLDLEAKATYMVTVTATDPGNLSDSVDVTIKLTDEDEGPEITGVDSRDYPENGRGAVATLRATDPERRPVYWSLATDSNVAAIDDIETVDNADVAHFSISANGVLSFNFPPDYESAPISNETDNTYKVVVVAADEPLGAANRELGSKAVTVNVTNVEETETVTLSARQGQVNVALIATYNDADNEKPSGTDLTWKWYLSGSEVPSGVTQDDSALMSSYTPTASGSYRVEASYTRTDGSKKSASATISVRTAPTAPAVDPAFPSGSDRRAVDENSPPSTRVGTPVSATDPGDVLTYTIGGTDASSYRIDPATGQITVGPRTSLATGTHTVEVTATDPAGGSTTQSVTITINDVNAVPVITAGDTKASVEENTAIATQVGAAAYAAYPEVITDACEAGTCTWSLEGTDAGDFEISNAAGTLGQLTFKESPNYEMPADANGDNVYMVTVVVTDAGIDGKGKLSAERDMVVTVTNVNEPVSGDTTPVVTLSSLAPKVGVALTATLDDPDGGEKDIEWQWSITGADTASVPGTPTATSPGDISGATSDTYTPKINDVEGTLTATVMYADAVGSSRTGTAAAVNGVVQDLSAQAPVFKPKPASRSVPENYATDDQYGGTGGTDYTYPNVGAMVTATDPNGDTLTYSLGGTDAGSFTIHQGTGQISVKTATKLDLEAKATYMVTVTATDPGNLSDSVAVTIKLTDVDEGPVISVGGLAVTGPSSIDYAEDRTGMVATYSAAGPDAARATWSLEGADASDFTLMNGTLKFKRSPNYEMPMDMDKDNTYEVTVTATDGDNASDTIMVTIMVTNVNEKGMVTLSTMQPLVGTELTATLTDPDGNPGDTPPIAADTEITGATWQWSKSMTKDGAFMDIEEEATMMAYTPVAGDAGYYLRATATYADGEASSQTAMKVSENTVNTAPEFDADTATRTVAENTAAAENIGALVAATDADAGDTLTYTLGGADAGSFDIESTTGQLMTKADLDYETRKTYTVTVTASDGDNASDTIMVTIMVTDENDPPVFPSDTDTRTVAENTAAAENIGALVAATDADAGDTLTYTLGGADAGSFDIESTTGQLMTKAALDFETKDSYTVTVTATDGDNASDTIMVTIMVTDENDPPVFPSDTDTRTVAENTAAAENIGALVAATDADAGDTLTYTLGGADAGSFDIESTTGQLMTKADLDYETRKTYTVTVTASDGDNASDTIMVTIMVTDENDPPVFPSDTDTRTVAENTAAAENIGALVAATDADAGDTLTYTLGGADAGSFDIESTTGQLMTKAALDFETKDSYTVTVTATDGDNASDTIMVTIMVTDENDPPVFPSDTDTRTVAENTAAAENIGALVAATDADAGDTLTYTLGGADAGSFDIESTTGQLMTKADLDYETRKTYTVTVTASDGDNASDTIMVTIMVTDENDPPVFPSDTDTRTVAENTAAAENIGALVAATDADAGDTLTYTLGGADAGSFDIESTTGQLMTKAALDFETKDSYTVTVTATDGDNASDTIMVTIMVTNVNEKGMVTLSTMQPLVGTELTATLTDPDGNPGDTPPIAADTEITGATWQWSKSMTKDGAFMDIEEEATMMAYTPVAGDAGYYLRATATYADGEASSQTAMKVSENTVNTAPEFDADTATRTVAENTAAAENIGALVAATDADAGDTLTYTLGGADAGSFDIEESTGQLMTMADLDYETETTYIVKVTATDTSEAADSVMVTINVTNVDEDGTVTLSSETKVGVAITATLVDVDGGTTGTTWQWGRSDAMDGTYTNIAGATLDSYTPVEADENMYLRATAMYTDGHGPGKSESMVSANAVIPTTGNSVADGYDANSDGEIDRTEVGQAVRDFIGRQIEHDDVLQVVAQYFKDLRSGS